MDAIRDVNGSGSSQVGIGIVGRGHRGPNHVRIFGQWVGFPVAAAAYLSADIVIDEIAATLDHE